MINALMTVYKVQTLIDNGIRVTLDMSETAIMQMAQFAECQRSGVVLKAEFIPEIQKETVKANGKTPKLETGTERKSKRTPAQEPGID